MEAIATLEAPKKKANGKATVPKSLVYEMMGEGKPLYYKGYQNVLNHTKTLEEIMACSSLQSEILSYLVLDVVNGIFSRKKFRIYFNEIGAHLKKGSNRGLDLAIFDKSLMTSDKVNKRYADVPPKIVIEVDIKADLEGIEMTETEYIAGKTRELLAFGVEKVFWIITSSETVIVAEQGKDWLFLDWQKDIELYEGHFFNVGKYLKEEGISTKR